LKNIQLRILFIPKTYTSHELEKHQGTLYLFSSMSCLSILFNQFLHPYLTGSFTIVQINSAFMIKQ
jgi:hypothetical protein